MARSTAPTAIRGGRLAGLGPGVIAYAPAEAVGFEVLPAEVRASVADLLVGPELAAHADDPQTRRRPDGSCYQVATGWWASPACLVSVEARRELHALPGGRFRPGGGWWTRASFHTLPAGVQPATSWWRQPAGGDRRGPAAASQQVSDVLDVLPPALVAPLRAAGGCRSGAWIRFRPGWARETIVAQRLGEHRVLVLAARRSAISRRALARADWQVSTLDAPVLGSHQVQAAPGARRQLVTTDPAPRLPTHPPA